MQSQGTILIVEDDALTREALAELLGDEGYEVEVASDGVQGQQRLLQTVPDLVISDVSMPRLDGFELVRWLRQHPLFEDVPVILWSARGGTDDKVSGLDVGADDYLCKPVDPDELLAKVRRHLCRASRSRELFIAATIDSLTGVRNRRGLLEVLDAELARAERTGQRLSVFMVDLDDFKAINDRDGHAAGDAALRRVASGLVRVVRPYDTVGRYGGDEFLIVASGLSHEHVADMLVRLESSSPGVGLSVGAVTAEPGDTRDTLVARSDAAMYAVKRSKRATRATRPL